MRVKMLPLPVFIFIILCSQAFAIEISVPSVEVDPGAIIVVPINVDNAVGIAGGDITLEYDSTIIKVNSAQPTDLAKPLSPVTNTKIEGKIRIAMAAVNGLGAGSGALFEIEFEAVAQKGSSPLSLTQVALFDENVNDIVVTKKDGSITIKEKQPHPPIAYTINDGTGKVDDNIAISISVDNLAGVAGGDIVLEYDKNILSVVDVKATDLLKGVSVIINKETAGKISISMASAKGIAEGNGAFINITFKGLTVGESPITFTTATAFDEDTDSIVVNTTGAKIAVSEKPCDTPIIREHQSGSKILALQTTYNQANIHGHTYVDIWKGEFMVEAGQFLEYQVAMYSGNPVFNGAVDLITEDGKTLKDSGAKDQNNLNTHPATNLNDYARDTWYHRIISLDTLAGKKIVGAMLATDSNEHRAGLFRVYADNIQITNGKCTLLAIYTDEEVVPITGKPTANETTFAGADGTSDYSVSIVGETPVTPVGKITTTWGNLKK